MSIEILIFILIFAFVNIVLAFYLLGKELDKPCYYPDALKNYEYFKELEQNEVINMRTKYQVTLEETRQVIVEVYAKNKNEAEEKAFEKYDNDKIDQNDFFKWDLKTAEIEEVADD